MPFALVLVGLLLIVTSIRGTQGTLWNLFYDDMAGSGGSKGFVVWLAAIGLIAFAGYYKPLQTPSRLLLGLVVIGIFLSNEGVYKKLSTAFTSPLPAPVTPASTTANLPQAIPVQVTQTGSGSKSGAGGTAEKVVGTALKFAPLLLA